MFLPELMGFFPEEKKKKKKKEKRGSRVVLFFTEWVNIIDTKKKCHWHKVTL